MYPLPGSSAFQAVLIWPADVEFESWYSQALRKLAIRQMNVQPSSFTAEAVTPDGRTVQIKAVLRERILTYDVAFR